ncbi:MAG: hypothetical protein LBI02_01490, partial [Opitutaceae bacterium]|nr:hypothetical protein [Opitutaceae bacterium]
MLFLFILYLSSFSSFLPLLVGNEEKEKEKDKDKEERERNGQHGGYPSKRINFVRNWYQNEIYILGRTVSPRPPPFAEGRLRRLSGLSLRSERRNRPAGQGLFVAQVSKPARRRSAPPKPSRLGSLRYVRPR